MKKKIWIDCDPGVDDALAIFLADSKEDLEIIGISAVNGNVPLEVTDRNARKLVSFLGLDIPVYRGAERPILGKAVTASVVHGEDGLGGFSDALEDVPNCSLTSESMISAMGQHILAQEEPVVLVALGPLTNVALLLLTVPDLKTHIESIYLMGGGLTTGNRTARAEFNFFVDPEAAAIVYQSGIPITMAGLDVTEQAIITKDEIRRFSRFAGKKGEIALSMLESYASRDGALHDPVAVLALTNPELFFGEELYVCIDTSDGEARGQSYADRRKSMQSIPRNAFVLTQIDREGFLHELDQMFQRLDRRES